MDNGVLPVYFMGSDHPAKYLGETAKGKARKIEVDNLKYRIPLTQAYYKDVACGICCIRDNKFCIFAETRSCAIWGFFLRSSYHRQQWHKFNHEKHNGFKQKFSVQDVLDVLAVSMQNGFKCHYCKGEMLLYYGKYQSWSIEHLTSLGNHGSNKRENLVICCSRCNQIKGGFENTNSNATKQPQLHTMQHRLIWRLVKGLPESPVKCEDCTKKVSKRNCYGCSRKISVRNNG